MTLAPAIKRLEREIEEVKAERQALQSEIPDDLKPDSELPLDHYGAIDAALFMLNNAIEALRHYREALEAEKRQRR